MNWKYDKEERKYTMSENKNSHYHSMRENKYSWRIYHRRYQQKYELIRGYRTTIGWFKKLKTAKFVAELIEKG